MDIKGKNCIVTGGADGLGLACCRELLRQGCQRVMILDINQARGDENTKKLQQEFGKDKVMFVKCDVTRKDEVDNVLRNCHQQLKQIDILVNCAQILNENDNERTVLTNLNGTINCNHHALRLMGKDQGGRGGVIVNMSSVLGLNPLGTCPTYCATKRGVITYTRCLALPHNNNRTGVKMIVLCAGVTENDLNNTNKVKVLDDNIKEYQRELNQLPRQDTENIGQALTHVLNRGDNGSVWIAEGNQQAQEIQIPNRDQMKRRQ